MMRWSVVSDEAILVDRIMKKKKKEKMEHENDSSKVKNFLRAILDVL